MNDFNEHKPVNRADWRTGLAWIRASPVHTLVVVLLFGLAGFASCFGLLRWQSGLTKWSFAVLCWGIAISLALGRRKNSD